jgi:hypothetical protein
VSPTSHPGRFSKKEHHENSSHRLTGTQRLRLFLRSAGLHALAMGLMVGAILCGHYVHRALARSGKSGWGLALAAALPALVLAFVAWARGYTLWMDVRSGVARYEEGPVAILRRDRRGRARRVGVAELTARVLIDDPAITDGVPCRLCVASESRVALAFERVQPP